MTAKVTDVTRGSGRFCYGLFLQAKKAWTQIYQPNSAVAHDTREPVLTRHDKPKLNGVCLLGSAEMMVVSDE